jgi:hypothetical protein
MAPWISWLTRLILALPLSFGSVAAPATTPAPHGVAAVAHHRHLRGADISWPNCRRGLGIKHRHTKNEPMPEPNARFVIVGVTNGPGFHPNPCLAAELAWVADHDRLLGGYALTTYPTTAQIDAYGGSGPYPTRTARGRLRNAAYAEATYNINTIAHVGMVVPMLWVDVEPYPFWGWSASHRANRAVISTVIRRYREAGHRVGIYTYANGWKSVAGSWRLPGIPTWSTAGQGTRHQAKAMCTSGPSGGTTWVAQWYTADQDFDLLCPSAPGKAKLFS